MLPRACLPALAAAFAALALTPTPALAINEGQNLLQSRPSGLAAFPGGGVNTSSMTRFAVSQDGCRIALTSESDALVSGDNDRTPNVYVRDTCGSTDAVRWVSKTSAGVAATDFSQTASISPNGRWVAFHSRGALDGPASNDGVFVHDLTAGTTSGVSRWADGPNRDGIQHAVPTVSDDGDVAFATRVALSPDDKNTVADVYVRRRAAGTTELVSRGAAADAASDTPSISADGTTVAFASGAQLSDADTNTLTDVYARSGSTLTLLSRNTSSALGGTQPAADADGSAIAFVTNAPLEAGDTNSRTDVYRWTSGATTLVSRQDGAAGAASDGSSSSPAISASGDVVTFLSDAKDLTTPAQTASAQDVFRRDVAGGTTRIMSRRGMDGPELGDGATTPALSADGGTVAFATSDNTLFDDDADDFQQVAARTVSTGAVRLVSRAPGSAAFNGGGVNRATAREGAISADGRFVAFVSESDGLLSTDDDRYRNAYVRDNRDGTTQQVNLTHDDVPGVYNVTDVVISDDGRRVAFTTAQALTSQDRDGGHNDVFVRDLEAGTTTLMSRGAGATATAGDNVDSGEPAISGDGKRVAFSSRESLAPGDANTGRRDVFVRDVAGEHTIDLASPGNTGDDSGMTPALNRDGSVVAFITGTPLDAAHDADTGAGDIDVYLRDIDQAKTELVSRATGASGVAGNGTSFNPALSADGKRVVFDTGASNLNSGPVAFRTVQLRDRAANTTTLVSRPPGMGATAPTGQSQRPSISADGTRIAYQSTATNIGNGETLTGQELIWMRNTTTMGNALVTRFGHSGVPANGPSTTPAMSANGRCVAFTSNAPNIDAGQHAAGDHSQVWLRAVDGACPDSVAPVTTIGGVDGPTANTSPQFTLTANEASAEFECKIGDGQFETCTSPLRFTNLADGDYTFSVRARDLVGNVEATPKVRSFTVDTVAPTVEWTDPIDSVTGDATPTAGFQASEAGAQLRCWVDTEDVDSCASPLTLEPLDEGQHELEVRATDAAGNMGPVLVARFEVDLTGAVADITGGPAATTADTTPTFAFESEGGATFRCGVDTTTLAVCGSPWTSAALREGEHVFRVQAIDPQGTAGPVVERTFTVDVPDPKPDPKPRPKPPVTAGTPPSNGALPSVSAPRPTTPAPRSTTSGGGTTATAKVVGRSAKIKRGRLSLTVRCAGAPCRGTLVLRARIGRKSVVLGRTTYAVGAGKTAKVTVKLSSAGRKALRKGKRVKATADLGGATSRLTLRG